jgi:hypothetical protein
MTSQFNPRPSFGVGRAGTVVVTEKFDGTVPTLVGGTDDTVVIEVVDDFMESVTPVR